MTAPAAVNERMCRGKALHLLITAFEKREREEMEERGRDGELKRKRKERKGKLYGACFSTVPQMS